MKKKFYGALLLGSLFLAGGMVSCSDYDDDINSLNERVDALEKTVAELQKAIEAGAVITNVQSTENGVTVTLSNGKTFEVKNGTNGTNGVDGVDGKPGSVVTIDDEGYWCIDDVRQTDGQGNPYKAQGEQGPAGVDGKDGCWYMPNEDGYWHKQYYNEEGTVVDEKTENSWTDTIKKDVVTVVYDSENGRLLISNAEGLQEGEVVVIETWGELKSLAVIPYAIDKETSMPVVSFYNIVKDGEVLESTDATAHFRLNPNNANIKDWEWSIIDRKAVVRAEGDNVNDLLAISEVSRGDGEMIVSLKSKKSIADLNDDEIAIFALNGTNTANGNNIASDYAKVTSKDLKNFAIINPTEAPEFIFDAANEYPTDVKDIKETDANLVYTESIDLKTLVWTWAKDVLAPNTTLENLNIDGLTYEFSKPEEYLGSDDRTNQQEFVNLDGSIVTVNDYTTAAIGRTPIFLAKALVNGTVVATGYIKLDIVESAPAEDKEDEVLTVACGTINYQKLDAISANTKVNALAWQVVNQFYSKYGLTAETFHTNYNEPTESDIKAETGVVLTNNWWDNGSATSSDAATIDIDPATVKVVDLLGKEREATITFTSKNKKVYPNVVVKFTYTISDDITFPALNNDYLVAGEENMVEVKGRIENGTWTMISGIKEHFKDYLSTYKLASNHVNMYAELPLRVEDEDPFLVQHGAEIVLNGEDEVILAKKQDIQLTEPLTTAYRDYVVYFHIVLANGEQQTMKYKVRFSTPFEVSINAVELKTLASPTTADLAKAVVIKGVANEVIYEKGALVAKKAEAYAITNANYFSMVYGLSGSDTDSWESFGNRLTISNVDDPTTTTVNEKGQITWDNEGALLQNDKIATSEVTVTAGTIAVIKATGKVTVLSSENSKN